MRSPASQGWATGRARISSAQQPAVSRGTRWANRPEPGSKHHRRIGVPLTWCGIARPQRGAVAPRRCQGHRWRRLDNLRRSSCWSGGSAFWSGESDRHREGHVPRPFHVERRREIPLPFSLGTHGRSLVRRHDGVPREHRSPRSGEPPGPRQGETEREPSRFTWNSRSLRCDVTVSRGTPATWNSADDTSRGDGISVGATVQAFSHRSVGDH